MNSKLQYFSLLDILSPKPKIFVKSQKRIITLIGLILSLTVVIGYLGLILYFFLDFLFGTGVAVIYSKEEVSQSFFYNLDNKLLSFYFMDLSSGPINPRIASILPVIWKYNGTQSTITELTLEPCKFDYHFPKETYAKVFAQLKLDDFQCIAKGERNLSLFFDNNNWSGQYIILYLRTCTNTTENGNYCFPQEKIDQHLSGSSIYLSYLIESMNIAIELIQ